MALLLSESARCREILAELSQRPDSDQNGPFHRLPLSALIEVSAHGHLKSEIGFSIEIDPANRIEGSDDDDLSEQPIVQRNLEAIHGLGNIIQNAIDFAASSVIVRINWDSDEIGLEVLDDGPGFAHGVLGAIGEPYISTRSDGAGMGLGVFIAKTLLEHTGARVNFGNRREGGARVAIVWPRAILEAENGGSEPDMPVASQPDPKNPTAANT